MCYHFSMVFEYLELIYDVLKLIWKLFITQKYI